MRRPRRRFARAAVLLSVVGLGFCFFTVKSLDASVLGGVHDFSSVTGPYTKSDVIAPSGTCSACHIPHGADPNAPLWPRSLSGYVTALTMNGNTSGKPDYTSSPTLACYDCHDNHTSGNINDVPAKSAFASDHQPQDIAFGGDGPGGTKPGYYEHAPANPAGGSYGVYSYPGQFNPANPDNLAKTGGHFFRKDPTGSTSSRPDIGDKLSCRDCHDPHSSLDAFLRTNLPDSGATPGLGPSYSSVTASTKMTNNVGRTRNDALSRKICAACHGYSDNGTPVKYNQISPVYTNSSDNVPKPPTTVSDHNSSAQSACVSCHDHDSVGASCTQCHGYPPGPGTVPNYPASKSPTAYTAANDSHARHVGRQSDAPANSSSVYSFQCDVCHYNNNHQNDNVDIRFGLPAPIPPSTIAFVEPVPPGGATCSNIYCHSNGGSDNTMVGYYRSLAWGTPAPGCNGCHGVGTTIGNRNYGMPNYTNGGEGAATANSHAKHVIDKGYECSVCHAGTVSPTRSILGTLPTLHVNGVRNVVFGGIATGVGATPYDNATKTCSVSCHGNAGSATLPRWGGAAMSGCGACHLNQGATSGIISGNGLHHPHSSTPNVKIACETCHANHAAVHDNAVHVGGPDNAAAGQTANIRFTDNVFAQTYDGRVLWSRDLWSNPYGGAGPAPSYAFGVSRATDTINSQISFTNGTCSQVWCHSNAAPAAFKGAGGTNRYRTPAWMSNSVNCMQCHQLPGTPPPLVSYTCTNCHAGAGTAAAMVGTDNLSAAHITHVASDRYKFTCDECHAWTAANDSSNIIIAGTGNDNHVNGVKTVKFGATLRATTVNQSAGVYDPAARKCATTYCHSNGTSTTSFGPPNDNIAWNSATGSVCTTCHGGSSASSIPIATGSHTRHLSGGGYGCTICHHATVSDNVTINVYDNHVNGQPDVAFDPATATGTYTAATKTCSVSCHGADSQVWGGTISGSCFGCHSGTEPLYKPQNNAGVANPVDNNEYIYSGHGRSGSNYPGSNNLPAGFSNVSAAPVDCYYCHSQVAAHTVKDANDPFRLGYGADSTGQKGTLKGAYADNTDLLCLGCHGSAAQRSGHDKAATGPSAIDAQVHARGITGTKYTWPGPNYAWKCVDCHDPHGDGKSGAERYMMLRSGINAPTGSGDANAGSDAKSRPKRIDANVLAVAFNSVAGFASGSYAQSGNGAGGTWGPCEVCHTQTTAYSRTADNLGTHASRTNRCTTCHPHKAGFAPTACKGCHGPDGVATSAAAPNVGTYWTSSGHGMTTPKTINVECEACHDTSFATSADHKTDGTAGAGPPPANINTQFWPGKTENANNQRNQNTAHLAASYFPAGFPGSNPANKYNFALSFDQKCGNQATGCHPANAHNHHPVIPGVPQPVDRVLRFSDGGTASNPKAYFWYSAISDYPTQFYQSRSPWDVNDITTNAVGIYTDNNIRYGLCVSCHDPHGTNAPANILSTTTNRMLRGDSLISGQFCNTACHTTRTPP